MSKDRVVILTHKFWQQLGANTHILGTSLRIDGEPRTIVGVLAPGIADRAFGQVIVPLVFTPDQLNHDFHWLLVMGRLKPGVTIRQAQTDMDAVTAHIAQTYPKSVMGWGAFVDPLKNEFLPDNRKATLWLLLGAVAFVLLIACVNVINLLLARSTTRQKEIAIRGSLGATPRDIFAHLLTESLVLAAVGGLLGIGTGYAMLHALIAVMPPFTLPAETDLKLNAPVLIFTVGAATLAGLVFGCAPAWFGSHIDPADALKESGRSGLGVGYRQFRRALVVGEFTLALALLAGAGLAIHSFLNLQHVDLGVRTDHVLTFYLPVPDTRSKDPADIIAYYRRILASVRAVPGVSHAAASLGMPLVGVGLGTAFSLAGTPAFSDPSQRPGTGFQMVTPDYYQTYGIRIVKGRSFTDHDDASSVAVRAALGADRRQVVGIVIKEGAVLAGAGLGFGLIGAYLVGRVMRSTLFDVRALDIDAFGIVALVLLSAALLACFVPAYHAASAEPLEALRAE